MILSLLLVLAIVLGVVGIVFAILQRPWTGWITGAAIALVLYVVFAFVVH